LKGLRGEHGWADVAKRREAPFKDEEEAVKFLKGGEEA